VHLSSDSSDKSENHSSEINFFFVLVSVAKILFFFVLFLKERERERNKEKPNYVLKMFHYPYNDFFNLNKLFQ